MNYSSADKVIRVESSPLGLSTSLSAVDIFCGAGGFSLGLKRAGFFTVLANDYSIDPELSYRYNLEESYDGSHKELVTLVDSGAPTSELRRWIAADRASSSSRLEATFRGGDVRSALSTVWLTRWKRNRVPAELDLLVAGPPCQGFSSAGRQEEDDERNLLVFEAIRVLRVLRPRVFVLENVPGMLHSRKDIVRRVLLEVALRDPGYWVWPEVVECSSVGVPQTRKRILLVCVRRDIVSLQTFLHWTAREFPLTCPTTRGTYGSDQVDCGHALTSQSVLGDLGEALYVDQPVVYRRGTSVNQFRLEMRSTKNSYLAGDLSREQATRSVWNHCRSSHAKRIQERFRALRAIAEASRATALKRCNSKWLNAQLRVKRPSLVTNKQAVRVLLGRYWPALTVTSLPDDIVHYREDRTPTVRELARLQTFPDWFRFLGVRTTGFDRRRAGQFVPQFTQVANAVPPRVAFALGLAIQRLLGGLVVSNAPQANSESHMSLGRGAGSSIEQLRQYAEQLNSRQK